MADMIKIMLCDDLKTIRDSFVQAINRQEDMQVVYAAASGSEAVEYLNHCEALPDIILMDIQMESEKAGIEATRQIHEKYPRIKILMLTIFENDDLLIEAYLAGAVDYIVKDVSWKKICDTLRSASVNENFVGTIIREKTREKLVPIYGTPPDLLNPPDGCPFAARCPYAMELCRKFCPQLSKIGPGHESACWLHNRSVKAARGEVKLG